MEQPSYCSILRQNWHPLFTNSKNIWVGSFSDDLGSAWPLVLGLVSAGSAIGIQSGPGSMWWEMEMLLGLFWVSLVDLVGIGPGAGGRWIPGSSEKPTCPSYFLYFLSCT